jgi:hypothetical protein
LKRIVSSRIRSQNTLFRAGARAYKSRTFPIRGAARFSYNPKNGLSLLNADQTAPPCFMKQGLET